MFDSHAPTVDRHRRRSSVRASARVIALAAALLGWLWLSAGHLHLDGDRAHSTHAACSLCSGLDRAAPPPAATAATFTPTASLPLPALPDRAPPTAAPAHRYASRAPPTA